MKEFCTKFLEQGEFHENRRSREGRAVLTAVDAINIEFGHCTTLFHISLALAKGSKAVTWRRGAAQPPTL